MKRCIVGMIVFAVLAMFSAVPPAAAGELSFAYGGELSTGLDPSGAPGDAGIGLLMNLRIGVHGALLWSPGSMFEVGGELGAATGLMGLGILLEVPVRAVAIFGLGPIALEPFAGARLSFYPFGPNLIVPAAEAGLRCIFGFVSGFYLEASYVTAPVNLIMFGVGGQLRR